MIINILKAAMLPNRNQPAEAPGCQPLNADSDDTHVVYLLELSFPVFEGC